MRNDFWRWRRHDPMKRKKYVSVGNLYSFRRRRLVPFFQTNFYRYLYCFYLYDTCWYNEYWMPFIRSVLLSTNNEYPPRMRNRYCKRIILISCLYEISDFLHQDHIYQQEDLPTSFRIIFHLASILNLWTIESLFRFLWSK